MLNSFYYGVDKARYMASDRSDKPAPAQVVHTQQALDAVTACLTGRRTISRFAQKKVDPELLIEAINIARWAPNHHLSEPWHFYVLGADAIKATIDMAYTTGSERKGHELGLRKARRAEKVPAWIVVTCKKSADAVLYREDYAATCCAIHNASLYLWQVGVGMKWCTGPVVDDPRYYKSLGIDGEQEQIVGVLRIGYPQVIPTQKRKSQQSITTLLD